MHFAVGCGAFGPHPTQQKPKSAPGNNEQVSASDAHWAPEKPPQIAGDTPSELTDITRQPLSI
ncbi:hypothetical protein DPMN_163324 [Dreissena polymorpha]|uniref:Uncharacterized protein n=1 Tax=Dreissena polymorpha TaxID=45954 RepID=A0A9D4IUB7_DREPO|nr:hypothetical protein DPMN_163324 [Dreissena polymorpha]